MGEMGWGVESKSFATRYESGRKENKTKQMRDCNEGKKMEE